MVGTLLSYISSLVIQDGIIGGAVTMSCLMLTLRFIMGYRDILHPANGWVAVSMLTGYSIILLTLPRCHLDRYENRFCRETNPTGSGYRWLGGTMISFFLMASIVMNEYSLGTPLTPVGWLGVAGSLLSILATGIVIYGLKTVPMTQREQQHLYLQGAFVDTPEQSVRILSGYDSVQRNENMAYLGAFDSA